MDIKLNDFELGWVAGFLEGEGCFTVEKHKTQTQWTYLRVQIMNTDLESLERIQSLIGGRIAGPYTSTHEAILRNTKKPKPYYRWCLARQSEVIELIDIIKPYLSEKRQTQISNAIHTKNIARGTLS